MSDPSEDFAYVSNTAANLAYVAGEAESLLSRYMGDLYAPVSDVTPGESSSAQSSFFVEHSLPKSGIALPPDFINEYERVSKAPRKSIPAGAHHFRFAQPHSEKFFDTEGPSPELLALGASLSSPNAFTTPSFRKEDKKWMFMSDAARFSAKLAVFQAALIDLLSRADDLGVTSEDRAIILALLLSIAEQSCSQALSFTFFAFENRRLLALTSLGLQKSVSSVAVKTLPLEGPHLFAGHFLEAVDSEISMHKRAFDLAAKLKPTPAFPRRASPPFRSSARRPFRGSRVRGFRGFRGGPRLPSFGRVRQPPSQAAGRDASRFSFTSPPPPTSQ